MAVGGCLPSIGCCQLVLPVADCLLLLAFRGLLLLAFPWLAALGLPVAVLCPLACCFWPSRGCFLSRLAAACWSSCGVFSIPVGCCLLVFLWWFINEEIQCYEIPPLFLCVGCLVSSLCSLLSWADFMAVGGCLPSIGCCQLVLPGADCLLLLAFPWLAAVGLPVAWGTFACINLLAPIHLNLKSKPEKVRTKAITDNIRFEKDVQFVIGHTSRVAAAFWYPTGGKPWSKSQHYSASCDWLPLDITVPSSSSSSYMTSSNSSWDAATAFSLLLSVLAFCLSVFLGYWVSRSKAVPFTPIDGL
ncbi:hypothetical protein M5K25_001784 [Dendrobium thyrsiflorum]|uniref:Transmembrane protein n=1 Tax=Dendrobium thyrsiflorum TaxID=117978 RepID=A0ABD0W419_DENTH